MHKILPIILAVVLSGCATISISETKLKLIEYPQLNKVVTAKIGEDVVKYGNLNVSKGIVVKGKIIRDYDGFNHGFKSNQERSGLAFKRDDDECYGPLNGIVQDAFGTQFRDNRIWFVCVRESDVNKSLYLYKYTGRYREEVDDINNEYNIVSEMTSSYRDGNYLDSNFLQILIYNGKINNSIKFLYREFIDNISTPNFKQDISYNLEESNIITFKGLKIKIISSTSQSVTYEVLDNFKDIKKISDE
jgi:hypothetical protein